MTEAASNQPLTKLDPYENLLLADTDVLKKRKQVIQYLLAQSNDNPLYKLVYNENLLHNFSEVDLKLSYIALWSDYMKAGMDDKVQKVELNLRLLDLVLRAQVLHGLYIDFISRVPSIASKMPIHSWVYYDVATAISILPGSKVCSSKKSILKSLPLNDDARLRIMEFIAKNGTEIIVYTEFINLAEIATIPMSRYQLLYDVLDTNKGDITMSKTNSGLQELFKIIPSSPTIKKGTIIRKN
ncbi:unnamed protein product [Cunninghamella echinulata]